MTKALPAAVSAPWSAPRGCVPLSEISGTARAWGGTHPPSAWGGRGDRSWSASWVWRAPAVVGGASRGGATHLEEAEDVGHHDGD